MANTVTLLSYANTFGDWVVTTNALVKENNDFAANNYIKPTGTLYLNNPTLGLQVANNAVIAGTLQVQGTGSSAYIQNNLRVDQQVYFTNTSLSLVTSGQANIGGPLIALSSGTGLNVANNSLFNGTITVFGQSNLNGNTVISNTLFVTGNTNISNTVYVTGNTYTGVNLYVANNIYAVHHIYANNTTLRNQVLANTFVANNSLVSPLIYSSNTQSNYFVANTSVQTPTLIVIGTEYVDTVLANTLVTTPLVTVTTRVDANSAVAYFGSSYTPYGNTVVSSSTRSFSTYFTANTSILTPTLIVTGTEYIDTIRANTLISTPVANVTSSLDANNASGYFNTLQTTGQFTVGGNFVINGSTVYNANNFTLNAGSSIGLQSAYTVNRGITGANAAIRWNEGSQYWDINNVTSGSYYRILTTEQLDNTVLSTSTITAPTSNVANTLNNNITAVFGYAQSAYASANNVGPQVQPAFNKANAANVLAQSAYNSGNSNYTILSTYSTSGYDKANAANVLAQSAYNSGNSNYTILNTYSTSGYDRANAANVLAQSAYNKANTGSGTFNGTTGQAISSNGIITFTSTNGVTITGTSNTLTINTPQNVAIGAAATLAGTNFSSIPNSALNNSSITVNGTSISLGGSGTATANAQTLTSTILNPTVVTSSLTSVGTISSGTWSASFGAVSGANLTNLTAGNLSGTIPTGVLGNSVLYVGTTSIALNRSSTSQTLSGISIDGNAGTVTSGVYTSGSYSDPSWITSLAGSKISGDISGGAGSVAWGNVSSKPSLVYNDGGTYGINISGSAGYASSAGSAGSASSATNITAYTINQNLGTSNSPTFASVYAGAFYYSSDKTLKTNVQPLGGDIVDKLIPVSFQWIETKSNDDGFIAQDVQRILPSAVSSNENGTLSINPLPIVSHLTHKVQKQQEEINQLKEQVQFLFSKIGN